MPRLRRTNYQGKRLKYRPMVRQAFGNLVVREEPDEDQEPIKKLATDPFFKKRKFAGYDHSEHAALEEEENKRWRAARAKAG